MRYGILLLSAVAVFGILDVQRVRADWPNFRGPSYDGVSDEKLPEPLTDEPLKFVWERNVGSAFSSFACVGDRVYTCGTRDNQQVLFSLNAETGDIIWQRPIEKAYRDSHGGGTRSTPTVSDGRVYILGAHGRLLCVDAEDGDEVWSHSFGHKPMWGYSGSVLIHDDLAIATGGKDDGVLVAFDKKSGRQKWKSGDEPVGYSTPYPFVHEGRRLVVGFSGKSALVVDPADGRELLRIPWETMYHVNAASPLYHEGHLFLTSGYETGCGLFKLRGEGDQLRADPVWRSKVLLNKFQSCVLIGGKLYSSDQKGLKCVDFMTGEASWKLRRDDDGPFRHGTVVLIGDHLMFLTEGGQLQIAKASPDGFDPIVKAEILGGRCWSVPVVHQGRLYARNLERLVCFGLRR